MEWMTHLKKLNFADFVMNLTGCQSKGKLYLATTLSKFISNLLFLLGIPEGYSVH